MGVEGGVSLSPFWYLRRFSQKKKKIAIAIRRMTVSVPRAAVAAVFPLVSEALFLSNEVSEASAEEIVGSGGSVTGSTEILIVVAVEITFEVIVDVSTDVRLKIVAKVVVTIVETFVTTGGGGKHGNITGVVQFGIKDSGGSGGGGLRNPVSPPPFCLFVFDIQF